MRFSIIVPMYNAIEYISECLESVLCQPFTEWELIIVDDGSIDGSGELADQYAANDNRIRVIHKANSGQFFARKEGILAAKGEYIVFLDSDDYYEKNALTELEKYISEYSPDIIMFSGEKIINGLRTGKSIGSSLNEVGFVDKKLVYEELISSHNLNSVCFKAYKRELFEGDRMDYSAFGGIGFGEDKIMNLYPITKAKTIFIIPNVLYIYRENEKSVMYDLRVERISSMIANHVFLILYNYMQLWEMTNPVYHEIVAVYYLCHFSNVFFYIKKNCNSLKKKKACAEYNWKDSIDKRALKYIFSKKINIKDKIKLILALYFYKIAVFI